MKPAPAPCFFSATVITGINAPPCPQCLASGDRGCQDLNVPAHRHPMAIGPRKRGLFQVSGYDIAEGKLKPSRHMRTCLST